MKQYWLTAALMVCAVAVQNVHCEDNKASGWKGKAELGLVNTSGNTKTSSTNARFGMIHEGIQWRQEYKLEQLKTRSQVTDSTTGNREEQLTAERSFGLAKVDYKINEAIYSYGLVDYTDDRFSGYDYVANASLGLGYSFIKRDDMELSGELGFGRRRSQLEDSLEAVNESVSRLAGKFFMQITETARFNQELVAEFGEEFDKTKSTTSLTVNINSSMALSLGYEVIRVSDPPDDKKKSDSQTTVNLVYSF